MITETLQRGIVQEYLQHAVEGDGRAGVRLALDLVERGVLSDDVIVSVLGAAQMEVGERWWRNECTVADEHLASGVTQKALDAIAHAVEPPAVRGRVVVACAEGDWHALPAQMFSEMLRGRGYAVAFLGASTPADHVATLMSRHRPDALAVSCTLPLHFWGVTRLVDAAHRRGIPVIAGGRALGAGRASRLGADGWASGVDDAIEVLDGWQRRRFRVLPETSIFDPALLELDLTAPEIAATALDSLSSSYPPMASFTDRQLARTREDLAFLTRFISAARLVDDPTVLTDMLDWLRTLLAYRGVPATAVGAGLTALAPIISDTDLQAGQLVFDALQSC